VIEDISNGMKSSVGKMTGMNVTITEVRVMGAVVITEVAEEM